MRLALDITHSSHSSAQTGIQQVARGLWHTLPSSVESQPIVFDKYAQRWRKIDRRESNHLHTVDSLQNVKKKRPHWSTWQRIRGACERRLGYHHDKSIGQCEGVLIPEFFAEWVGPSLAKLKQSVHGPMVAVFHDAIAFHHHEWGVRETIERYPQYLRELSQVDGIACVSEFSRHQLLDAFDQISIEAKSVIEVIPLGLRTDHLKRVQPSKAEARGKPITFLTVATIEPRKNHNAMLDAADKLWQRGLDFHLLLVGMLNRGSGRQIESRIQKLQAGGRSIEWRGSVSSGELAHLYEQASATLFPSLCEGFGLPVLESLYFGKPCLTSNGGALAEVAPGGGTLISEPTTEAICSMMENYLSSESLRQQLSDEASIRSVRTMQEYTKDLIGFTQSLSFHP